MSFRWSEADLANLQKYIDSGEVLSATEIKQRYGITKKEDAIRKKMVEMKSRFNKQVREVKDKKRKKKSKKDRIEETVEDLEALQKHLQKSNQKSNTNARKLEDESESEYSEVLEPEEELAKQKFEQEITDNSIRFQIRPWTCENETNHWYLWALPPGEFKVNSAFVDGKVVVKCSYTIKPPSQDVRRLIADFGDFSPNWENLENSWTLIAPTGHPNGVKAIRLPEHSLYGLQVKKGEKLQLSYEL